ncbi:unnamed protein product [Ectocarpus fasciculatus]
MDSHAPITLSPATCTSTLPPSRLLSSSLNCSTRSVSSFWNSPRVPSSPNRSTLQRNTFLCLLLSTFLVRSVFAHMRKWSIEPLSIALTGGNKTYSRQREQRNADTVTVQRGNAAAIAVSKHPRLTTSLLPKSTSVREQRSRIPAIPSQTTCPACDETKDGKQTKGNRYVSRSRRQPR